MTEEMEMDQAQPYPKRESRKMAYNCLKCNNDIFYVMSGESKITCAKCLNVSTLVLYSCKDCCPSGYRFCPVCRKGTETNQGCFL